MSFMESGFVIGGIVSFFLWLFWPEIKTFFRGKIKIKIILDKPKRSGYTSLMINTLIRQEANMTTQIAEAYEHPLNGVYSETVAIMPDGRKVSVCTQYSYIAISGDHNTGCPQVTEMGGQCSCPQYADIMANKTALIAEAKYRGKFGYPRRPKYVAEQVGPDEADEAHGKGYCASCESFCYGDCGANHD